jgi:hypothetical protein
LSSTEVNWNRNLPRLLFRLELSLPFRPNLVLSPSIRVLRIMPKLDARPAAMGIWLTFLAVAKASGECASENVNSLVKTKI